MALLELTIANTRQADVNAPTLAVIALDPHGEVRKIFEEVAALRSNVAVYFGTTNRVDGQVIPQDFQFSLVEVNYLKDGRVVKYQEGTGITAQEVIDTIDRIFK